MKKYGHIFICIAIIILFVGCQSKTHYKSAVGVVGEYSPVTRAEVAKMLALSKYGIDEIREMPRQILFTDTNSDFWYDKYINAAYTANLISGADETHFEPDKYLTLRQAQYLITRLSGSEGLKLEYSEEDRNKPIAYSMWCEAFYKAVQKAGGNISEENLIVISEEDNCVVLDSDYRLTDKGIRHFEGITDNYLNNEIKALTAGNEIVSVEEVISNQPKITGAEVLQYEKNGVTLKLNGCERFFYYDGEKIAEGQTVNFQFEGDSILSMEK